MDTILENLYNFLFENKVQAIIANILATLAILTSIYYYKKSKKSKIPTYALRTINLVKEYIQKIEAIQILYQNNQIDNLSISKIAFWNDGKEIINFSDIAPKNPLRIIINPKYEILDCKILFSKNHSNDFHIHLSKDKKYISIEFDYFDLNEGIIIEIFHTGNNNEDLTLEGQIKSVKSIIKKDHYPSLLPFSHNKIKKIKKKRSIKIANKTFGLITLSAGLFLIVLSIISLYISDSDFSLYVFLLTTGVLYSWIGYIFLKRRIPKGFDIFDDEF